MKDRVESTMQIYLRDIWNHSSMPSHARVDMQYFLLKMNPHLY